MCCRIISHVSLWPGGKGARREEGVNSPFANIDGASLMWNIRPKLTLSPTLVAMLRPVHTSNDTSLSGSSGRFITLICVLLCCQHDSAGRPPSPL